MKYKRKKGKKIMKKYCVCGITKDGLHTAWSSFKTKEEMLAKAEELLTLFGIIAFETWEVTLP